MLRGHQNRTLIFPPCLLHSRIGSFLEILWSAGRAIGICISVSWDSMHSIENSYYNLTLWLPVLFNGSLNHLPISNLSTEVHWSESMLYGFAVFVYNNAWYRFLRPWAILNQDIWKCQVEQKHSPIQLPGFWFLYSAFPARSLSVAVQEYNVLSM